MQIANTPEFQLFTLIFMRMNGMIFLNPIFGRTGIPAYFKAGLAFMLSLVVFTSAEPVYVEYFTPVMYGVLLLKELLVGFLLGFIIRLFEMIVIYAGAVIDMQVGLSISSAYDPQTGMNVGFTGSVLQTYFVLLFFATNAHLAFMKIIMTSGDVVNYGSVFLSPIALSSMLDIFITCVELVVRLAFPIIAFGFLVEVSIGILMKIIPQINIFVLSIQLRVIVGILILSVLMFPVGTFFKDAFGEMIFRMQEMLISLGG